MVTLRKQSHLPTRAPRSLVLGAGLFVVLLALGWFGIVRATDLSSTNFIVRDPVSAGGGGLSTSSNFQLWSSFSQNASGKSTSASNELRAGFLYFSDATPSPTPPPPAPPPPAGTGSGSQTTPLPSGGALPPPPISIPGFIPPLISIILGDQLPPICLREGLSRSDFNCDGNVDLKDLSVLLTKPKFVTGKILSYLFSDWTRKLPVPDGGVIAARDTSTPRDRTDGLAQVGDILAPSEIPPAETPTLKPQGFFRSVWQFFRIIGSAILRFFGVSR